MIYLSVLIPIIGAIYCKIHFKRSINILEFGLSLAAPILLIFVCNKLAHLASFNAKRYNSGYAKHVTYYEAWDEKVPCTHDVYCTDKDGRSYVCGKEHSFDVDYHSPYWDLTDNWGVTYRINSTKYDELKQTWSNSTFIDMHRDYYRKDGDAYRSFYDDNIEHIVNTNFHTSYKNKVMYSDSLFNFQEITEEDFKLYSIRNRPSAHMGLNYCFGYSDKEFIQNLKNYNSLNNIKTNAVVWFMVYKNQSMQASILQESHWKGGHDSDLIINIGLDTQDKLTWSRVYSWCDNKILHSELDSYIQKIGFKPNEILRETDKLIQKHWVKKDFKDFDYLRPPIPLWSVIVTYVLVFLATGGILYWSINNGIDEF